MEEKRKYKRFKKEVKIHFDVITAMSRNENIPQNGDTVSIDISEGGVLFIMNKPIPVASSIECQFHLPGYEEPIYAKARVVRVEELTEYHQYDIGIKFIAISKEDEQHLVKFIID